MALVVKDRIRETTTTTGSGTITLAGAVTTFDAFSEIGDGNTTYYAIVSRDANEWEVGLGTYTLTGTTLARTTVLASSNSGSAVVFSAGTKDVICTYPAGKSVYADASDVVNMGTTVISGSSSSDMLRITQTGAGNALLVEDSANPDSTPFVVDATGTLVSGATSSYVYAGSVVPPRIQVQSVGGGDSTINATSWATGVNTQATLMLARSEGGVVGTHTVVDSGDNLGKISFQGSDGTSFVEAATISAFADGAASASDMPGRIVFSTTADGASSTTERMRIDSSGRVGIGRTPTSFKLEVEDDSPFFARGSSSTTSSIAMIFDQTSYFSMGDYNILRVIGDSATGYSPGIHFRNNTSTKDWIIYQNVGSDEDSLRFKLDATDVLAITTGSDVGIGATSPLGRLHLNNSGANNVFQVFTNSTTGTTINDGMAVGIDSSGNSYVIQKEALPLIFSTSNTERMRIDSGGNVGIGTNSPLGELHLYRATGSATQLIIEGGSPELWYKDVDETEIYRTIVTTNGWNVQPGTGAVSSPTWSSVALNVSATGNITLTAASTNTTTVNGRLQVIAGTAGSPGIRGASDTDTGINIGIAANEMGFVTGGSEHVRIDSSGNVGIGTSSPTDKLQVNGHIRLDNGNADGPQIILASAGYSDWYWDNYNGQLRAISGSTARLRIDPSGLVGIGRTPTTNLLEVAGTIESTSGGFKFPDGSTQTKSAGHGLSAMMALGVV
jgi:hypothetical protein